VAIDIGLDDCATTIVPRIQISTFEDASEDCRRLKSREPAQRFLDTQAAVCKTLTLCVIR
jgi:hypothetical protein